MFQYAAGLGLAQRQHTRLKVDKFIPETYNQKQGGYQLASVFKGPFSEAGKLDYLRILGRTQKEARESPHEEMAPNWSHPNRNWIKEASHNYCPEIENTGRNCYLAGYWQSEKYFLSAEHAVRKAFEFKTPLTGDCATIGDAIHSCNSVGIHVRRGDYVSNKGALAFHGICDWDYYWEAIEKIKSVRKDTHFFVFSDDPQLVRQQFSGHDDVSIVDIPENSDPQFAYRDMQLMALCKHHIIANSTFSWWGAWLARHPEQVVIAPKRWFSGANEDVVDIYCAGWLTL